MKIGKGIMEETRMDETVTLIRGGDRIVVKKRNLACKSHYFLSLFSHNFNDSQDKEHSVNYDVSLSTLQNFVDWIHDDEERVVYNCHLMKASLMNFITNDFEGLLNLLQVGVLFSADSLITDIIDIIILYWLLPEKVIDIWLLAQELAINVLRDICLSVCLDRFDELPVSSLLELSKSNISRLIGNNNVRSPTANLKFARHEWMRHHSTSDVIEIKEERKPEFIQGIPVYKVSESTCKDSYVYAWDGETLKELVRLKSIQNWEKVIMGMQVTGRGCSIYMVGGEAGLGTGHFNRVIWRYCLISKKWYYQATLPVPRRHMIAVFLKNKLTIVGGVGRHRLKLSSVDVLDIHTGQWTKAAKVPETFTEVPPHCVANGKLFLMKSFVYIYHPDLNNWETISVYNNPPVQRVDVLLAYDSTLFVTGNDHSGKTILSRLNAMENVVCAKEDCLKPCSDRVVRNKVSMVHEHESCELMYAFVAGIGIMLLNVHRNTDECSSIYSQTEIRKDLGDFIFNPTLGCFKIIDPQNLCDTVHPS